MCFLGTLCLNTLRPPPEPSLTIAANTIADPVLFIRCTRAQSYLIPRGAKYVRYVTTFVLIFLLELCLTSQAFGIGKYQRRKRFYGCTLFLWEKSL